MRNAGRRMFIPYIGTWVFVKTYSTQLVKYENFIMEIDQRVKLDYIY